MEKQRRQKQRAFIKEAFKLLDEFENALTELIKIPDNEDRIGRVFRVIHTIKGASTMFGFTAVAAFAHEIENIFELVRKGKLSVTRKLINLSFSARDLILEMLYTFEIDDTLEPKKMKTIISDLKALIPPDAFYETNFSGTSKSDGTDDPSGGEEASIQTYLVHFQPSMDIFANGTNPVPLLDELSRLGKCHIIAHTDAIPLLSNVTPEFCYVSWDIILSTNKGIGRIEDVFVFVTDACRVSIQVIDKNDDIDTDPVYRKLGESLVERGDLTPENFFRMLENRIGIEEMLTEAGVLIHE